MKESDEEAFWWGVIDEWMKSTILRIVGKGDSHLDEGYFGFWFSLYC